MQKQHFMYIYLYPLNVISGNIKANNHYQPSESSLYLTCYLSNCMWCV